MNRVELLGGLVRDPDLRAIPSGAFVCSFTLGIKDAVWSAAERRDVVRNTYVSCTAWGQMAETIGESYRKGDELYVLGLLTQEEVPKKDGGKETKTRVRVVWVRGTRKARPDDVEADDLPPTPF